jgi:hypothetical protein
MAQTPQTTPAVTAAKPAPPTPPAALREGAIGTLDGAGLQKILTDPAASEFQKAKACQRAGETGATETVPALAALLSDARLGTYARYGLEPIPGPAADEALRAALGRLQGNLLVGVVASVGKRRDAKALAALLGLMGSADAAVAEAAAAAVGSLGTAEGAKALQAALGRATGRRKMVAADAALVCAERFLADGKRAEALALYTVLSGPTMPQAARHGAMAAIVREETRVGRPGK